MVDPSGHRIAERACPEGDHELEAVPSTRFAMRCAKCGLSTQAIVDVLGHELQ